jgi:hypothetical protein
MHQWARKDKQVGTWLCPLAYSKWGVYMRLWGPHWHVIFLIIMTEMVLKTSVPYRQLMQLIAWEDFIEFSCCESSSTYIICLD